MFKWFRLLNKNGVFDNGEKKVYAETAIPYGTYDITLKVQSPKYKDKAQYKFCEICVSPITRIPSPLRIIPPMVVPLGSPRSLIRCLVILAPSGTVNSACLLYTSRCVYETGIRMCQSD